jgi:hypothetical protein
MTAKRLFLVLLLVAAAANAQMNRHHGPAPSPGISIGDPFHLNGPATVSGTVSSVAGHIINVANGAVSIDATGAKIVDGHGANASLASVTVGSLIVATVKSDGIAANAPIPATLIAVAKPAGLTLTGPVTAVDVAHNTFTLLGKTIQVTVQTSFGGPFFGVPIHGLADIQPNELVLVQANPSGAQSIVADSVLVMSMHVAQPEFIHGTVKSIAADAWVITRGSRDVTVTVNAQTQIVGNPKVGDTVDVMALTDSSGKLVAISIMKSFMPTFQMPH